MPYAEVTHLGTTWWGADRWHVVVIDGIISYGPDGYGWHKFGKRERVDIFARRELDKYVSHHKGQAHRVECHG